MRCPDCGGITARSPWPHSELHVPADSCSQQSPRMTCERKVNEALVGGPRVALNDGPMGGTCETWGGFYQRA